MNNKNKLGALLCLVGFATVLLANAESAFKADGLVESTAGGFVFPDGSVQKTSAVPGGPYTIGGTGPGGGFIYLLTADGLHGMEAAPSNSGPATGVKWGCRETQVGANAKGIGSGARNTDAILRACDEPGIAAAVADELVTAQSAYFDWHLPTKFDLFLMYYNLHSQGIGGFGDNAYWSSSEIDGSQAWGHFFFNNTQLVYNKDSPISVRAVRAF